MVKVAQGTLNTSLHHLTTLLLWLTAFFFPGIYAAASSSFLTNGKFRHQVFLVLLKEAQGVAYLLPA